MNIFGKKVPPDFVYAGKKALEDAIGEQVKFKMISFENGVLSLEIERDRPLDDGGWDANVHKHRCACKQA